MQVVKHSAFLFEIMKDFAWGTRTFVMGVVNVTPDSFSGDGVMDPVRAIEQGLRFVDEGADVLDVGGVSTRARLDTNGRGGGVAPSATSN